MIIIYRRNYFLYRAQLGYICWYYCYISSMYRELLNNLVQVFISLFIISISSSSSNLFYQLFWTQACPEGMCTNGTQVPCEVPSLHNPTTRKGWPHHRGLRNLLFSNSDVGSFTSHKNKWVKVLWDGTYGFSSLSERTRKSNHFQMSLLRQHFLTLSSWSGRDLNLQPPARQTGALPTDLTRRGLVEFVLVRGAPLRNYHFNYHFYGV